MVRSDTIEIEFDLFGNMLTGPVLDCLNLCIKYCINPGPSSHHYALLDEEGQKELFKFLLEADGVHLENIEENRYMVIGKGYENE
jgi:hypothetical protein